MQRLLGKKIVLTGVSRGVGLAAARLLLDEGAEVFGCAQEPSRLKAAHAELSERAPGRFWSLPVDLSEAGFERQVLVAVQRVWNGVDVLVNNAGVMLWRDGDLMAEPEGLLEQTMAVNVYAPNRLTRALLPLLQLQKEPRVIHVGSGAGTHGGLLEANIASYRLSKWALNGLTMLHARELRGKISVNALDPGWLRTDLGGPNAPGVAEDGAQGLLDTLLLPWTETGKFFKAGVEIPW